MEIPSVNAASATAISSSVSRPMPAMLLLPSLLLLPLILQLPVPAAAVAVLLLLTSTFGCVCSEARNCKVINAYFKATRLWLRLWLCIRDNAANQGRNRKGAEAEQIK